MKKCSVCKVVLEDSNFGKNKKCKDGLRWECKECRNKRETTEHKWTHWNSIINRTQKRTNEKHTNKNKKELDRRYRENNKEKISARAKSRSKFPNPQTCSIDGCNRIGQRHHEDYSKPNEIIWLCEYHHVGIHMKDKRRKLGIV